MSSLEKLKQDIEQCTTNTNGLECVYIVKSCLLKDLAPIEKDLEILELLKNKKVDIAELDCCLRLYPKNYLQPMSEYNKHIWNYNLKLVKEEYDILRKWLGYES